MTDLEKIIRPIVEGQIRGFLKEHPKIVEAVDWYKPRQNKTDTFVNSLAKRIVRDLCCSHSTGRIEAAVMASDLGAQSKAGDGISPVAGNGALGMPTEAPVKSLAVE